MAAAGKALEMVAEQQRALEEESERQEHLQEEKPTPAAVIAQQLKAGDPDQRATAAYDLGRIGSAEAIPFLTKALADSDGGVRRTAGRSLVALSATTTIPIPAITAHLNNQDPLIRGEVARCLGELEAREAAPALAKALASERDQRSKVNLVEALGRIHDPIGLPVLKAILADRGNTPDLLSAAVTALGQGTAHNQEAMTDLIGALQHPNRSVREAAHQALLAATGTDLGSDAERWRTWYAQQRL
jgi:HEAT repeat protein